MRFQIMKGLKMVLNVLYSVLALLIFVELNTRFKGPTFTLKVF